MTTSEKGTVSYKKKDGSLALLETEKLVTWTPVASPNSPPSLNIPIPLIKNFQATPATSASCMLKISVAAQDGAVTDYRFTFTSPTNAREELEKLKVAIAAAIQADKNPTPTPQQQGGTPGPSGTSVKSATDTNLADAAASKAKDVWNASRLESDIELQQELLRNDTGLGRTFMETVLKGSITASQFWSTRIHLLRAYAIEKSQSRGSYNVLSTTKPKTVDNVVSISLSREQIHDIFEQHPLVKRVYDENVPKISESKFWSRFFVSRLFKKLKGEKILATDGYDDILDKYLNLGDEANERRKRVKLDSVPNFINLNANEQHLSQKTGNRPDLTMRPEKVENVPLIRTLNSLSMKIVDSVTPIDANRGDQRDIEELQLTDLLGEDEEERIILKIQDQQRFFDDHGNIESRPKLAPANTKHPGQVLRNIQSALGTAGSVLDLGQAAKSAEEEHTLEDSEDPPITQKAGHLANATKQITQAIKDRRIHLFDSQFPSKTHKSQDSNSAVVSFSSPSEIIDSLPRPIYDSVHLTHSTTNEFLHHFWLAFLSGEERRATEINKMVTSLRNAKGRIEAVAKQAEEEKEKEKERRKAAALAEYRATGKKRRKEPDDDVGGEKKVREMLRPTLRAVDFALDKYGEALAEAEKGAAV